MPDRKIKIRGNDPRLSLPKKRKDSRSVEVQGRDWQWKTNGTSALTIYDPELHRVDIPLHQLFNLSKEEWEHLVNPDIWDYERLYSYLEVTPSAVKRYIELYLVHA